MSRKTKATHAETVARREADDKRRGTAQPKHQSRLSAEGFVQPGIVLVTNPFRVPFRRRPTIILPGRGSPAASGGEA